MQSIKFELTPPKHETGGATMRLTFDCEMIQTNEEAYEAGKKAAEMHTAFLDGYQNAELPESD
jgi:hypothetical protein